MTYAEDQERLIREGIEEARRSLDVEFSKAQRKREKAREAGIDPDEKEAHIQMAFISWCDENAARYPVLGLIYHIPNGEAREKRLNKQGKWYSPSGVKLKRMGARAAMPDLHLPAPRGVWASLYLEVKRKGGKPTPDQVSMHASLRAERNRVAVCDSLDSLKDEMCYYLDLENWRSWHVERDQERR
jgi:hypothetical protein